MVVFAPSDVDDLESGYIAGFVLENLFGHDEVAAWIGPLGSFSFLLTIVHFVDLRPFWPRVIRSTIHRRLGHDLKLNNVFATLANAGANAVRASITTTDDDDFFACSIELRIGAVEAVVELVLSIGSEEIHGLIDAIGITAFDRKITWFGSTATQDDGIKLITKFGRGPLVVFRDEYITFEYNAFILHELDASVDNLCLVEFHVGDAIHEQSARAICTFKYGDCVASLIELIRSCEASWT